jgi:RNAse (barnase) inhibitor barstar
MLTNCPHLLVTVDGRQINDWQSFHDVFVVVLGLPPFYGRNMDAWIDCMTNLDDPTAGLSYVHAPEGGVVVLNIANARDMAKRVPEQYAALVECSAFVNWRRMERGAGPVLALSFYD